jgi:hypothetical protein
MLTIKVLGPDCRRRNKIVNRIRKTLQRANIAYEIILITDDFEIMSHGRLSTPAVIANGSVVSRHRVPKQREILDWAAIPDVVEPA